MKTRHIAAGGGLRQQGRDFLLGRADYHTTVNLVRYKMRFFRDR